MPNFLGIAGKTFLVTGFANRKSVAWHVAETLEQEGANIIYTVRSQKRHTELLALKPGAEVIICDFEKAQDIHSLESYLENKGKKLHLRGAPLNCLCQLLRRFETFP